MKASHFHRFYLVKLNRINSFFYRPAKYIIHDAVKNALIKDGWKITHEPYTIRYEEVTVYADLGAEYGCRKIKSQDCSRSQKFYQSVTVD